jgi:hypothetical protein
MQVDEAQKAHDCQSNPRHRLGRGDKRLKVSNGRGHDHYCVECAVAFINRDIAKLQLLLNELSPQVK